jgi:immune inhibitor A
MSHRHTNVRCAFTDRCLVAPSPQLRTRIRERLRSLAEVNEFMPGARVAVRTQDRPGFNDGLIVPGAEFPLETPLSFVRSAAAQRAPLRGNVRIIVVLVDFVDAPMTTSADHFRDLFFSTGKVPTGSVREYFSEVSANLIAITGEVVGPYRLPRTLAAYAGGKSGTDNPEPNARTMARDTAQLANGDVNFAPYDNDGNGFVDAFIVVHAGPGGEETGSGNHIWSHKWVLAGNAFNADNTKIFAYLTVPEDCRIGVCAHELGHLVFGWPDLYDTDESSEGLGNWCLMAGGSWNGNGDIPAHPSAWCKAGQGWVSVVNRTTNADLTLPDVKASKAVHRLWKNGAAGGEYFLIEHRKQTGYDRKLPGEGLLVYHIDEAIEGNENERHPKVKLMEADNQAHLQNAANRGDDGDPYPGRSANKTLDRASSPNSKSYGGVDTCVAITNITKTATSIKASVRVRCAAGSPRRRSPKPRAAPRSATAKVARPAPKSQRAKTRPARRR